MSQTLTNLIVMIVVKKVKTCVKNINQGLIKNTVQMSIFQRKKAVKKMNIKKKRKGKEKVKGNEKMKE